MKEKPKKSVRMWVARDKDGSLYLYKNKPTEKTNGSNPQWLATSFYVICNRIRSRLISICKMGRQ